MADLPPLGSALVKVAELASRTRDRVDGHAFHIGALWVAVVVLLLLLVLLT